MDKVTPRPRQAEITRLLRRWKQGDAAALDELLPLVRSDLLLRAKRYLAREHGAHSMRSSDIIQEAWLRILKEKNISYESRNDFYGLASTIMRHILVDHARSKLAERRGGGLTRVSLGRAEIISAERYEDLFELHEAMERLSSEDERKAKILDMYYFGGLTIEEIAGTMNLAIATVHKHKKMAEARVRREMDRR
ncbi:MAG TPA: ECF-type sigma factor [Pyrinomonadaceae bacterium]|nr:ECF-type sigma factor [Pyrinomonadaceae bacterium]